MSRLYKSTHAPVVSKTEARQGARDNNVRYVFDLAYVCFSGTQFASCRS